MPTSFMEPLLVSRPHSDISVLLTDSPGWSCDLPVCAPFHRVHEVSHVGCFSNHVDICSNDT